MKASERRAQVLVVARDVFAEKGYHAAKIDDIVDRAHIARGTFYLYFKDKRAVFGELLDDLLARLRAAIRRVEVNGGPTVVDQLRANVRRVFDLLFEERALTKILVSDAVGLDPGFDEKLLSFYDQVMQVITGSLAEGERLGLVRPGNHAVVACSVIGAMKEIVYQTTVGHLSMDVEEVLDALFALFGRALLMPVDQGPETWLASAS